MILDTSALFAVLAQEPDADRYIEAMAQTPPARLSAGTFIELARVCGASLAPGCCANATRSCAASMPSSSP